MLQGGWSVKTHIAQEGCSGKNSIQIDLKNEKKEKHIGSWWLKRPGGYIQAWLDPAFQCIIRNQPLSISQLYFYALAGLSHMVAKVTSGSSKLLFHQLSNPNGKRMLLSIWFQQKFKGRSSLVQTGSCAYPWTNHCSPWGVIH